MDWCKISVEELTMMVSAISLELARDKSFDEIMVLRNIASQVAQTLFTIASQNQYLQRNCADTSTATTFPPNSPKKNC